MVSKEYLDEKDNVLLIDDFLANGKALEGLIDICSQANATVEGIGILIEKFFKRWRKSKKTRIHHRIIGKNQRIY